MIPLTIVMDAEKTGFPATRALAERHPGMTPEQMVEEGILIHLSSAEMAVGALHGGMTTGRASVAFCFELPDGRVVLAETSLRLFNAAALGLAARYGEEE